MSRGAPDFLRHRPSDFDGMTITDLVFPAFLFIVGIAVPFALGGRLRRGEARGLVWRHVLVRSLALVVMGVLMVNAEHGVSGVLSAPVWNVVSTLGLLLVWGVPRERLGAGPAALRSGAGIALLLFVALAYRNPEVSGWIQLRPYWWGILGLIGWAYLGVASLYVLAEDWPAILGGAIALFYCVALADANGLPWLGSLRPLVGPVVGTHGALVLAGALLGVLLRRHTQEGGSAWRFAAQALGLAAAWGAAGGLLHSLPPRRAPRLPRQQEPRDRALGPRLVRPHVRRVAARLRPGGRPGARRWPRSLTIAGENPLVAYLMAPFLLSLFALVRTPRRRKDAYAELGEATGIGLLRSRSSPGSSCAQRLDAVERRPRPAVRGPGRSMSHPLSRRPPARPGARPGAQASSRPTSSSWAAGREVSARRSRAPASARARSSRSPRRGSGGCSPRPASRPPTATTACRPASGGSSVRESTTPTAARSRQHRLGEQHPIRAPRGRGTFKEMAAAEPSPAASSCVTVSWTS